MTEYVARSLVEEYTAPPPAVTNAALARPIEWRHLQTVIRFVVPSPEDCGRRIRDSCSMVASTIDVKPGRGTRSSSSAARCSIHDGRHHRRKPGHHRRREPQPLGGLHGTVVAELNRTLSLLPSRLQDLTDLTRAPIEELAACHAHARRSDIFHRLEAC